MEKAYEYLEKNFPVWEEMEDSQKKLLAGSLIQKTVEAGAAIKTAESGCEGLYLIVYGRVRAYILSEEGKELTLYRLLEQDICLFSASCMMQDILFEIYITAETDVKAYIIPAGVYQELMDFSLPFAKYMNRLMASRFSDVMWLIEQVMFKSFDKRLAAFLLEESAICGSRELHITHEKIAAHLGSAREVVTRMLRFFQTEGMVELERGIVRVCDEDKLLKR